MGLICCSLAGWTAVKVVAWARDLPNRIVIDGDQLASGIGSAVVQSYHEGLRQGDPEMQFQILRDFTSLVDTDDAAREWIRTEYSTDLEQLRSSPDAGVAALAADLVTRLQEPPDSLINSAAEKKAEGSAF